MSLVLRVIICLLVSCLPLKAQKHTQVPFEITGVELLIAPDQKSRSLNVETKYSVESIYDSLSVLTLQATRLSVASVTSGGKSLKYTERNDTLFVETGLWRAESKATISIKTSAKPGMGFHWTPDTTLFSNSIQLGASHWFPVLHSPKMKAPIKATFVLSDGLKGVFSGNKVAENSWESQESVYLPNVGFAISKFNETVQKVGVRTIYIYSKAKEAKELVSHSYSFLENIEKRIGSEFPYKSVSIVQISDLRWMPSQVRTNLVYIDQSSNINRVLSQLVVGSKFYKHTPIQLWATAFLNKADSLRSSNTFMEATYIDSLLNVAQKVKNGSGDQEKALILLAKTIFEQQNFSLDNNAALSKWFIKSGWIPDLSTKPLPKSFPDTLFVQTNVAQKQVRISSKNLSKSRLLTVIEIGFKDSTNHTLSISPEKPYGEILLKRSPRNVIVRSSNPNDVIRSNKTESMWVWQLKNDTSQAAQIEAVNNLAQFTENPDLQLALNDQYSKLPEGKLKAAYVETLGELLKGATGTHSQFIAASNSKNQEVRNRAFYALRHYNGNDEVQFRLQSAVRREEEPENRKQALVSLASVMDSLSYTSFLQKNVLRSDFYAITTTFVDLLEERSSPEMFRNAILPLLQTNVPWHIRVHVAKIILSAESGFSDEIIKIFSDEDPRVRYIAWSMWEKMPKTLEVRDEIKKIIWNEYDIRVLHLIPKNEDIAP